MRLMPTDFAEYHRLRRRARQLTVAFLLPAGYCVYRMGVALGREGPERKEGIGSFFAICVLAALAWWLVVPAWRRSFAARPVVLPLDPTPGQMYGVPELDDPPRRHTAFSGEIEPPTRW